MSEFQRAFSEKLIQRATQTLYRAETKCRRSLVERLTAKNAETFSRLLQEKAIFHRDKKDAPSKILLDTSLEGILPEDFFTHPTHWIESQPAIRPPEKQINKKGFRGSLENIWQYRHDADVERVKRFSLMTDSGEEIRIVSKRVNPKWEDLHEAEIARQAQEAGLPTPRVLAEILDHGNIYIWFEFIPGVDLLDLYDSTGLESHRPEPKAWHAAGKRFLNAEDQKSIEDIITECGNWERAEENLRDLRNRLALKLNIQPQEVVEAFDNRLPWLNTLYQRTDTWLPHNSTIDELIQKTKSGERKNFVWGIVSWAVLKNSDLGHPLDKYLRDLESKHALPPSIDKLNDLCLEVRHSIEQSIPQTPFQDIRYQVKDVIKKADEILGNAIFGNWQEFCRQKRELRNKYRASKISKKDLELRNILLRWDDQTDRPVKRSDDSFDLYILDWEKPGYKK